MVLAAACAHPAFGQDTEGSGHSQELDKAFLRSKLWHGAESLDIGPISALEEDKAKLCPWLDEQRWGIGNPGAVL